MGMKDEDGVAVMPEHGGKKAPESISQGMIDMQSVNILLKTIGTSINQIHGHSKGGFVYALMTLVLLAVLGAGAWYYQTTVVIPAQEKLAALTVQANAQIDKADALARVLLESLASQSKAMTSTVNKKLTALGFEPVPKP